MVVLVDVLLKSTGSKGIYDVIPVTYEIGDVVMVSSVVMLLYSDNPFIPCMAIVTMHISISMNLCDEFPIEPTLFG